MRLKPLLILTFLFTSIFSSAQKVGSWDAHFSYTDVIDQIVDGGDRVYVLTSGKVFSYFPEDDHLETFVKKDRGNSNILKIEYNEKNEALILFRENYDIDILYANGNFATISYLKNATQNIDKTVYEIYSVDDLAYLSMGFGILVLNVAKEEIKEVGLFNKKFYSTCIFEDYLYAATELGPKRIPLAENMQDFKNWGDFDVIAKADEKDFDKSSIVKFFQFRDKLSFLVDQEKDDGKGLPEVKRIYSWYVEGDDLWMINGYAPLGLSYITNEKLMFGEWGKLWIYGKESADYFEIPLQKGNIVAAIPKKGKSDEFWAAISGHYLSLVKKVDSSYEILEDFKVPAGPWNNTPFYMTYQGDRLLVTGGGYTGNRFDNPGYLSFYKNGKWNLFDRKVVDDKFGVNARDYNRVITDPTNRNRMFVSSWGDGMYEFLNDEPTALHTPETTGGVLEDIFGKKDFVRMGAMKFDKSGNLWTTSALVSSPIKVLTKDGKWNRVKHSEIGYTYPGSGDIPKTETNINGVMIDKYNRKWFYSFGGNPCVFILDDKKTPSDVLDDEKKYVTSFVDQDNKSINVDIFYDLQEDQTGNIWVATSAGPYVIYGTSNIFKRELVFNKIKIPRNDGTNNVDILLEGTSINALAIDGANRKWLGTPYGAYLISANGLETIQYFNMDNSPMPSNEVISLAIDPENGTVYIGTDKGLVSFVGDAIEGKSDYSNVYAFPNPVRPEYEGVITVTGLQTNSNVKITDVRGNILKQGLSLGGQYVWDGRNPSGTRVDTGVYLVFGSSEDGKSGMVTKILIVK